MLKRVGFAVSLVLGLLGIVAPTSAHAALACPVTIDHDTTLHHDLDCSSLTSGEAIYFDKAGLTLDLNGHKIIGHTGTDTAYGVYSSYNNSTIKNGTVENFYDAVYTDGTKERVTNVHAIGDAADANSEGFYMEYGSSDVLKNDTSDGYYYAFDLEYGGGNRVTHSVANDAGYAFYTYYESYDVFKNDVSHGTAATTVGFYISDYVNQTKYINDSANGGDYGFELYCDDDGVPTALLNNTANNNSSDGFYLYDCYNDENYQQGGPLIAGNTANRNGGDGFYTEYTINATIRNNTANDNGDYGFNLYDPVGNVVVNNTANRNQSTSGFYIEDNYSYYNVNNFSNNVANNNSSYGSYADYGVPGSGNQASGNGSVDCYNVRCG